MESAKAVYILTLKIDDESFAFFNAQRTHYFPSRINYLQAHLTLFHHLQLDFGELLDSLKHQLANQSAFKLYVSELMNLGRGVAYKVESEQLMRLHDSLQQLWKPNLKPQDLQKLRPHITVQNKVDSAKAKSTLLILEKDFEAFEMKALGVSVWEYLGGPWRFAGDFLFQS